jgi:hypothetical protein
MEASFFMTETPLFRYVDDPHGYFYGSDDVPSPSTVFQDLGLVDSKWFKPEHRARGRAVHAGLHFALKGTLDWRTLDPQLHGYVKSGLKLVERLQPKIVRYETPLYHPGLHFAGTSDLEVVRKGWGEIWDWKSGKAPNVARYQTAAYEMLARSNVERKDPELYEFRSSLNFKRCAVELQEDGSIANLVKYDDHTDGAGWLNLLGAYRIRQALRREKLAHFNIGE